ncbi:MAG: TSUP family transporter [Candidatus Lokiarchaeota archaeon]|nr:TSUP family transporter [Candidatus Lokiarchaeota archaeon]MBD3201009.1 TSUP family transporter [Candidatus Lokiarchaeota archaeon]
MELITLLIVLILGLLGAFIDSSYKMGYGLLCPTLILLGYDTLIIIPILLFTQFVSGFSKMIYYAIFKKLEYNKETRNDTKLTLLFTITGMIGMSFAVVLSLLIPIILINIYITSMIIIVGIISLIGISVKFSFNKMYIISSISAFNQGLSSAGYGPLATYKQIIRDGEYEKTQAITSFSEAMLSGFGFLMYFIFYDYIFINIEFSIVIIISGIIATPIGALAEPYLNKKLGKNIISILHLVLGFLMILFILGII